MVNASYSQNLSHVSLQNLSVPKVNPHSVSSEHRRKISPRGPDNPNRAIRMVQARAGPGTGQPVVAAATLTAPPTTPEAEEVFDLSAWNQRWGLLQPHLSSWEPPPQQQVHRYISSIMLHPKTNPVNLLDWHNVSADIMHACI